MPPTYVGIASENKRNRPPFIRRRFLWVLRTVDSALNGLKLVLRHQYVALLFGISCLYEVVLTILDYQMKVQLLVKYVVLSMLLCFL